MKALILLWLVLYTQLAFAGAEAKLLEVHDGDTISVLYKSGKKYRIRLQGIDAPELSQPYGHASKKHLARLLVGKNLTVRDEGRDMYSRKLAFIFVQGNNINLQMVKDGYAWHYKNYYKSREMEKAQKYAKEKKLGLWKDKAPQEPWIYRRKTRGNESANNKPLIKSPITGVVICFDPEHHKITMPNGRCPKGSITVMK